MRIVQLANFWTPTSGGLRVTLDHLAQGYADRGHRVLQIVPGRRDHQHVTPWGRRTAVAAPRLPGTDYRIILRPTHLKRLLRAFDPDVVEVSDRTTLAETATRWAPPDVGVVLVAHERSDHIVSAGSYGSGIGPRIARPLADRWNPRLGHEVDRVVVPSRYAAEEWLRIGIAPTILPWGVDHDRFHPEAHRLTNPTPGEPVDRRLHLAWVGRMSAEKKPGLAIATAHALRALGTDVQLTMVGDGPLLDELVARHRSDTVNFTGHVADPAVVAAVLARATVTLSTSGIEAFGLTVAESLACGTPVATVLGGAAAEVAGPAGVAVPPDAHALAAAVLRLASEPERRAVAAKRGARFRWDAAVESMLAVHRNAVRPPVLAPT